jgi:hypothetical protein
MANSAEQKLDLLDAICAAFCLSQCVFFKVIRMLKLYLSCGDYNAFT